MLTKLQVFSAQPGAPELSLGGFYPNLDPVQIRDIDGLGPVKAEVLSTQFATGRGELSQGSNVGKRNIVLKLGLNPNWVNQTMSSLRQLLYRYLLPQAWCKLRLFSDDMPTVDIEGIVESFEPNIFSQDPEMVVSIICHKPDFVEADATIYYGVVDDGTSVLEFDYAGTVETGFEVRIRHSAANLAYDGPIEIRMQQEPNPAQLFVIDPVQINTMHYFKLSTMQNAKRAHRIANADGEIFNLRALITDESVWPGIKPGTNLFSVAAGENGQDWTLAFFNRYGGL